MIWFLLNFTMISAPHSKENELEKFREAAAREETASGTSLDAEILAKLNENAHEHEDSLNSGLHEMTDQIDAKITKLVDLMNHLDEEMTAHDNEHESDLDLRSV